MPPSGRLGEPHYANRYGVHYAVHCEAHYGARCEIRRGVHSNGREIQPVWIVFLQTVAGIHLPWSRDVDWVCVRCSFCVLRYKQSGRGSVDLHPLVLHQVYTPLREPAHDLRVHHVFNTQYASGQGLRLVVDANRNDPLRNDRPVVKDRRDEVHRTPMDLYTLCQGLGMRVQPWKRW